MPSRIKVATLSRPRLNGGINLEILSRRINKLENDFIYHQHRDSSSQSIALKKTITSALTTSSTFTVAAGSFVNINVSVKPTNKVLTLWNLFVTLYGNTVGGALDDNSTHQWPEDIISTSETLGDIVTFSVVPNWKNSFDSIGRRNYTLYIKNNHSASLDFLVRLKSYGLK